MGRLEVQGIVSASNGLPFVQFRMIEDDGKLIAGWQNSPDEARQIAQQLIEAASNSVYDAALIAWAKETWPGDDMMGPRMVDMIRRFRADTWGLPDQPEDWRPDNAS